MKLSKPIIIKNIDGSEKRIEEVNITKENFTARAVLEAEREFLLNEGLGLPTNIPFESLKSYQGYIAARIIGCRYNELLELPGDDFLKITGVVKGFLDGLDWEILTDLISEKSELLSLKKQEQASNIG